MAEPLIRALTIGARGMLFDALSCGPEHGQLVLFLHGFPEFADAWTDILRGVGGAGYRAVAFNQRGYSAGARPSGVESYTINELVADVAAVADALDARRFHLVGHDWGGILSWWIAAVYRERLHSLTVLSTPHTDALLEAKQSNPDQRRMSRYVDLFRLPFHIAEWLLLRKKAAGLKRAYAGQLSQARLDENIRRFREPGVLTAAINWYRALDLKARVGTVSVPTLFVWGTHDQALGRVAAEATARYVSGHYHFLPLAGASHWLLEEAPDQVLDALLPHLDRWS
jgi:pimeloyl-ACP methyl ester carboxylesterase